MKPAARFGAAGALVALVLLAAPRADAQTIVVGPGSSSVAALPGQQFSIPVVADMTASGGASLGSITARLLWRPASARFIGTTAGTFGAPVFNADSAAGTLKFAVANAGGATGTSVLFSALFQAVDTVATDTMSFRIGLDEVTAAGTFANLLPISVATSAMFCVSGGTAGDLNNDASVSAFDAAIVVTNAVGLPIAPYSVANGDVDGDGRVTTRDALGILTYVVGLPTPGFRIGQLSTGGCAVHGPGSVAIAPLALSLSTGDRLPLAAVTKDSSGTIIGSFPAIAWQSHDPSVATVDSTGQVTAVGAGTTRIVAVAALGVTDSIPVSVSAVRHVWYVNPAVAAGNAVELGSTTYPFSSINAAIAAAAAGDTVRVAPALYGEQVHVTKQLAIFGDSTAAGIPRLRNATGPAVLVDAVSAMLIRFQIEDSQGGVYAPSHSPSLYLSDITILRSQALGVMAIGPGSFTVAATSVAGAVDLGIMAESASVATIWQSRVDLVASAGGGKRPGAIAVVASDTVDLEYVSVQTADIQLNGNRANSLNAVTVKGVSGPGLEMNGGMNATIVGLDVSSAQAMGPFPSPTDFWSHAVAIAVGGAVRLDSSVIHDNTQLALLVSGATTLTSRGLQVLRNAGDLSTPTALVNGVWTARVAQANFVENGYGALGFLYGGTAEVDSGAFDETNVYSAHGTSFTMLGGRVVDGYDAAINVYSTTTVVLHGIEVTGTQLGNAQCCGSPSGPQIAAVTVQSVDSALVDSLWLHANLAGSIDVENTRAALVRGVTVESGWGANPAPYGGYAPTVRLGYVSSGRVAQSVIDDRGGYGSVSLDVYSLSPSVITVDTTTFVGSVVGVNAYNAYGVGYPDTLIVRGSSFTAGGVPIGTAVQEQAFQSFQVLGNAIDSVQGYAVYSNNTGFGIAENNTITHARAGGIFLNSANNGDSLAANGNTIQCDTAVSLAIMFYYAPFTARGNTITGCGYGISGYDAYYGPYAAQVRGNAITMGAGGTEAVSLFGYYSRPVVAQNDIGGGQFAEGITISTISSYYGIDTLHVDSNTVHDFIGRGIHTAGWINSFQMRGNLVTRFDSIAGNPEGVLIAHSGGARLTDNKLSATGANGFSLQMSGDTLYFDSTVVVDDSAIAVTVATQNTGVILSGVYNYLARNGAGMYGIGGQMDMSQSVFQGNRAYGVNGPISWNVNSNWWGDTLGPARPGNGSTGDSVIGANADTYLTAPPAGVPTGAPRAFAPRIAFQAAASAAVMTRTLAGATRAVRPANLAARRAAPVQAAQARASVVQAQVEQARTARDRSAP